MSDKRIVYGVGCCWWDKIDKASCKDELPCCPHCGSLLFEMDSKEWRQQIKEYAQKNNDLDYINFIHWLQGKCFKTYPDAKIAFKMEQGKIEQG